MSLLTTSDFNSRVRSELIAVIDRDDEGFLQTAINAAEGEAKGYLGIYNTDVLFSQAGSNRDSTLVMYLKDITLWHLCAIANPNINWEDIKLRYEDAIRWLKGIQAGKITPDNWITKSTPTYAGRQFAASDIVRRETHY